MEAISYDIEVTTDILHGWKSTISEIYVPEFDIFINARACFLGPDQERLNKAKNKTTIEVDSDLVKDLDASTRNYFHAKQKMSNLRERFNKGLEIK